MRQGIRAAGAAIAISLLTVREQLRAGDAAPDAAGNLLVNGDFEAVASGAATKGRLPPGWAKAYGSVKLLDLAPEARPGSTGNLCLLIDASDEKPTGGAFSALTPLDPKQALYVAGWVRPGHAERGLRGLYFGVGWYDARRNPIIVRKGTSVSYVYLHSRQEHGDWYRMEIGLAPAETMKENYGREIPPNAAFFDIRVFALNYPAPGWFDDIEARQMQPQQLAELMASTAAAQASGQPNLPLESVDIDTDWVVGWVGAPKAAEAAAELRDYLSRVLDQKVVATPWQPNQAKHAIVITDAAHAPADIAARLDGKRLDAFMIKYPVKWDGQDACLLVSHDERGYDFVTYEFLRRFLGVRWVGPGELGVVLEPRPAWTFPTKIDVLGNPDFEMRHWYSQSFSCRQWLAAGVRMGFHHALGHVFDPKQHGDTPDLYPLVGGKRYIPNLKAGKRALSGWQPCTGNPKSVDIAVQYVLDALASRPYMLTVSLSVNDGAGNICECELCRAQDARDAFQPGQRPNLSDRFFRFYNTVIERALEKNPKAQIAVLGYGAVKTPPKEVRVHPKIHVFHVCPSSEDLEAWHAAGAKPSVYLWLWDGGFLTVRPDLHIVADIVRTSHKLGGIGLYSEIVPHWVVSAPKYYVLAGIAWDTERDVDELLDEYFEFAYGKAAAPHVRGFFSRWYEVYRRQPEQEWHRTSLGWRSTDQMEHLRREDLQALDAALARAASTVSTDKQKQRLHYLKTYYALMRINADEYLTSTELSDPEWVSARAPDEVVQTAERTVGLTAEFDQLWQEHVVADRSGWLLEKKYQKKPDELWDRVVGPVRTMVSSAHETAVDQAMAALSRALTEAGSKDQAIAYWDNQLRTRPTLAAYIGPQLNTLKGVVPENVVANGDFETGEPGTPPTLAGWEFYEHYGMVKGVNATYAWEAGSGHNGKRAIAFGEGHYPEMKGIIQLEKGHRYELSFHYKTSPQREREPSLWIFAYDGPLRTAADIDSEKIHRFVSIRLETTEGKWRKVTRKITVTRDGTHIIQLASYYHKADEWTWWDDIQLRKIW